MANIHMYYDYELAYPESMGGAVFYVGKGRGDRWLVHEAEARNGVQSRKCEIIREIWDAGEEVVKRKVYETPIEQDAFIYEWCLINLIYGTENLANVCEGYNGGDVEPAKKQKLVSLTLPTELTQMISQVDTYTNYFRRLLSRDLLDEQSIEELGQQQWQARKRVQGKRADRYTMYLQLPFDVVSKLETFPLMERSLVVEYLARKDIQENFQENKPGHGFW